LYIVFFCLEKKCDAYIRDNLKAPSLKLVMQWGRQLHMDPSTIKALSARIKLRHALGISQPPPVCHHFCINAQSLGPDPGHLSNSKNWKRTTPRSFRSPYFAQGDIGKKNTPTPLLSFYNILTLFVGFFYYKKKKYGAFFCAVQTYTGFVYAAPIKNLKNETLFDAVRAMSKVKMQISSF
jgi:hypothetical protein